ncbi:maleylacetate reductase [Streptomyces tagetis]|uniref:Maleylacetate reductase n=1 Tax=Streptomyces tagetis TaxID=2820809 RepID=A0A940XBL1_9ACTN|nr:maleylacetate reductase [Streptomyces sp. RG38]MBQ0825121.1 maleylacetate reductase [Streptomyces sp. RG38]
MWSDFSYEALPMRVTFGPGRLAALPEEAGRLGLRRLLVLSGPVQEELAHRVAGLLGARAAGVFAGARMHVPAATARAARERAAELGADGCVAVGGGSAIGLGKAVARDTGLPVIAVPTTYSGSEMTPVWGLTEDGVKRTGRDPAVLPRSVVYDPELTLGLPVPMSVGSGINALAHAVEGLYAPDCSPVVALMAEEGVRLMAGALPRVAADPAGPEGRGRALRAAWLCGAVLGATTMSLHHKLCHVLGGTFDLPHAEVHTVVLPHVLAYNAPAAPTAAGALARALGSDSAATALWELGRTLGAPSSLAALGMDAGRLPEVVDQVLAVPYANPRVPTREELTGLLGRAQRGDRPE